MKKLQSSVSFMIQFLVFFLLLSISFGQLTPSEIRILFRLQQLLEFPPSLNGWTKETNFCYLPPSPSLTVICSGNHVTELTVVGNKSSPSLSLNPIQDSFAVSQETLSERFSIDAFFTTLTKLSSLRVLSLMYLGLWGPLPMKINRFLFLEVLNISSNFIYGEIPISIASLKNIRSIVLADNMFNGSVPDLSTLEVLEELDVGSNLLGPEFPSVGNKIESITLRNNSFRSEIPFQLKNFDWLQRLDISFNKFFGKIPPSLFSLPSIEYLNLAGNKLRGFLPRNTSCSNELEFVDLSRNLLFGKLPLCISYNSSNRIVLYSWNCLLDGDLNYQHPNSFCVEKALAVKPPIPEQRKGSSNKLGLIFGIAGAVMGGIAALGLLILATFRTSEAKKAENNAFEKSVSSLSSKMPSDAGHVLPAMRMGALGLPPYQIFSFEEIEEATNYFDPSNLLGEGSQGQLYKGWLRDGFLVVVRCLKLKQIHSPQSFLRHMEVISKLRHRHLVSILGHCITAHQDNPPAANTVFLVFEYVSNGMLRSHLSDWRKRDVLKWPQRVAATIGVARGIKFLHSRVTPGIFYNNLKIENILLDDNLTVKIWNYNLPMLSMVGSEIHFNGVETIDHLEGLHGAEHGEKVDVYQLGVILLEVITGKPITCHSELDAQRIQLEESLIDTASDLRGLVDPSIHGTYAYESLRTIVEITINCLSKDSSQRPSIEDVLWNLQYSAQVQDGWTPSSENLTIESYNLG